MSQNCIPVAPPLPERIADLVVEDVGYLGASDADLLPVVVGRALTEFDRLRRGYHASALAADEAWQAWLDTPAFQRGRSDADEALFHEAKRRLERLLADLYRVDRWVTLEMVCCQCGRCPYGAVGLQAGVS